MIRFHRKLFGINIDVYQFILLFFKIKFLDYKLKPECQPLRNIVGEIGGDICFLASLT
jgi:hypothetical protein